MSEEKHTHKVGGIEVNEVSEATKKTTWTRVWVALAMISVMIPCMVLGGYFTFVLVGALGVGGAIEIVRAPQKRAKWYIYFMVILSMLLIIYWPNLKNYTDKILAQVDTGKVTDWSFSLETYYHKGITSTDSAYLYISPILLGLLFIGFFWLSIGQEEFTFTDICYYFTMTLLVGLGFQALMYLRNLPFAMPDYLVDQGVESAGYRYWQSSSLLFYVLLGSLGNDIFAYFGGILFGKHKMNPRVSPKKTWEGFFIGWGMDSVILLVYSLLLAYFGYPMLPGLFDFEHWYLLVFLSLVLPLLGDLGDLSFSLVKRHFGFKDYSHLFGPHGGVLDRFDSVLFCGIGTAIIAMIAYYWKVPFESEEAASALWELLR